MRIHPKLRLLAQMEGITIDQLLSLASMDSVVMGACISEGCNGTGRVEPDCRDGYCEVCKRRTVQSPLVLAGMI